VGGSRRLTAKSGASKAFVEVCFFVDPRRKYNVFHRPTEWQACRALLPLPPGSALEIGGSQGILNYAPPATASR
jgi:hypothetical protein